MYQSFRQTFQQQSQLTKELADYWGYSFKNNNLDSKNRKYNQNRMPIVANICVRKIAKDIEKTDKIIRIEEELKAIENGRKLAKLTQQEAKRNPNFQKEEEKSPVIKMMEKKIDEYNYIVQHKHLVQRQSDQTRKILKMQKKSEAQKILEKIVKQKNEVRRVDLNEQILHNKYMAKLYRSYRQKLDNQSLTPQNNFKSKTMISQPAKSGKSQTKKDQVMKLEHIKRNTNRGSTMKKYANTNSDKQLHVNLEEISSNNYTETQTINDNFRTDYTLFGKLPRQRKYSKNIGNLTDRTSNRIHGSIRKKVEKDIFQPYIQQSQLQNFKTIEDKIKNSHLTFAVFQQRIEDFKSKTGRQSIVTKLLTKNQTKPSNYIQEPQQINVKLQEDSQKHRERREEMYERHKEKQFIFAQLLKKKNNRFIKIGLSRVLVKYDEQKEADKLLVGDCKNKKHNRSLTVQQVENHLNTTFQNQRSEDTQFIKQQTDNQHYERMCKNEKINLLLKKKGA